MLQHTKHQVELFEMNCFSMFVCYFFLIVSPFQIVQMVSQTSKRRLVALHTRGHQVLMVKIRKNAGE